MIYRAIGQMSGSSLDGMDIAMVEFEEVARKWSYRIEAATTVDYSHDWTELLQKATTLNARDYFQLDANYGQLIGEEIDQFITQNGLEHRVQLISVHGHTTFHEPANGFSVQLGNGAAIAAATNINVITHLRALDVALGGQGAPIVPLGEKLLYPDFHYFLNIGGIANISGHSEEKSIAFDICPANRILNQIAALVGKAYDENGNIASKGQLNTELLTKLNALDFYKLSGPKSLANSYGQDFVWPLLMDSQLTPGDLARTYVEHIAMQTGYAMASLPRKAANPRLMITGGGAFNAFLVKRITAILQQYGIETVVPDANTVNFKEAIIMAFLGLLRWREENTTLASVTGARRDSIGGAVWIGQEY